MDEILVAVDGSKYSEKVVRSACDLARKLRARITLLYVSEISDLVGEYVEIGGVSPRAKAIQYVLTAEGVTSILGNIVQESLIPHEILLESGDPAETIVKKAKDRNVAMIVLGLRRLRGMDKIRSLGSVSRNVIETAPCPVFVVTGDPNS